MTRCQDRVLCFENKTGALLCFFAPGSCLAQSVPRPVSVLCSNIRQYTSGVYLRTCSAELRHRERSNLVTTTLAALQGALLCGQKWEVEFQGDIESSVLYSVHEFMFLTGLRLNQWIILKISGMIMIKKTSI